MPPSINNTWYFDKKELKNTPSIQDGLDYETELRYRREGARLILDIGNKMGLRFDTIWTGVIYFHRFYMFRSFKDFKRYVMASCCLFLAGKVEETPKKCKDIIHHAKNLLDDVKFAQFGESPREEVMILERILLQTMNFDLQVDHSYSYLLKFAKNIKNVNDEKKQKMVQMAWTFINDSLQTTLHLQWEPDVIAVALMFLASRLTKLEIKDWVGKDPAVKMKWFEAFLDGVTQPLLEDICHQVLDLYSNDPQRSTEARSPNQPGGGGTPSSSGHTPSSASQTPTQTSGSRSAASSTAPAQVLPQQPANQQHTSSSTGPPGGHPPPPSAASHSRGTLSSEPPSRNTSAANTPQRGVPSNSQPRDDPHHPPPPSGAPDSHFNPYVNQFSASSFLNTEGQKTIQNLLSGGSSQVRTQNPSQAPPPPPPSAAPVAAALPPSYLPTTPFPSQPPATAPSSVDYHSLHYPYQQPNPYAIPPAGFPTSAPIPGAAPSTAPMYFAPHAAFHGAPIPQMPYASGIPPGHPNYPYQPPHGPYAAPSANHM